MNLKSIKALEKIVKNSKDASVSIVEFCENMSFDPKYNDIEIFIALSIALTGFEHTLKEQHSSEGFSVILDIKNNITEDFSEFCNSKKVK